MSESMDNIGKGLGVAGQLMDLAKDSPDMSEAGQRFANSALTVSKTINNCLLPLAALNYGFDRAREYFTEKFADDLSEHTDKIPEEHIVEPKPSIAAPAMNGLAFSHEEKQLRDMYLSLLSSAMDGREPENAHPSFVEIIKQISGREANLLKDILETKSFLPIIKIVRVIEKDGGKLDIQNNVMNFTAGVGGAPVFDKMIATYIDNWVRLGLVDVDYTRHLSKEDQYSWVESRPEYIDACAEVIDGTKVSFDKGILSITSFGRSFAKAVL